jgi:hypothetical protein
MAKEVKTELVEKTKEQYRELQLILEALEVDLLKNANGVGAAGARVRKALRMLKQKCGETIAFSTEVSKQYRPSKD